MERASSERPGPVRALAKGEPGREEPPDRSPWAVGGQANAGQPPAVRTAAPRGSWPWVAEALPAGRDHVHGGSLPFCEVHALKL